MSNITIDTIVDKVILREQLSERQFPRLLDIALDGYKQIFKRILPDYKTLLLKWDDDTRRFINFPKDYGHYLIVGVPFIMPNGQMSIMTLSRNDNMYFDKPVECECNCTLNEVVESEPVTLSATLDLVSTGQFPFNQAWPFGRTYRDGQYVGELYGLGGGQSFAGSFTVDTANRRFVFGTNVPTNQEIVLRYKPVAIDYDGQSVNSIPEAAEEALIAWTKWNRLNLKNSTESQRAEAEYKYGVERDKLNMETNGMTSSEILDAFFEGLTFGLSR